MNGVVTSARGRGQIVVTLSALWSMTSSRSIGTDRAAVGVCVRRI